MARIKDSIHDVILGERLSDNMFLDSNGQLICENVVLARTGSYDYLESELFPDNGDPNKVVQVFRLPEDVFDPISIKSMNYKPFVDEHPRENVTPETVSSLQKGFVTNVRRGTGEFEECLMADLVVTDPFVIEEIRSGRKRELSVGYTTDIEEIDGKYYMKNIRGNHIALCEAGRAGNARIRDSKTVFTPNVKDSVVVLGDSDVRLREGQRVEYFGTACTIKSIKPFGSAFLVEFSNGNTTVARHDYDEITKFVEQGKVRLLDSVVFDSKTRQFKFEANDMDYSHCFHDKHFDDPADEKELDRTHFIPDAVDTTQLRKQAQEAYQEVKKYRKGTKEYQEAFDRWSKLHQELTKLTFGGSTTYTDSISDEETDSGESLKQFKVVKDGRTFVTTAHNFDHAVQKVKRALKDAVRSVWVLKSPTNGYYGRGASLREERIYFANYPWQAEPFTSKTSAEGICKGLNEWLKAHNHVGDFVVKYEEVQDALGFGMKVDTIQSQNGKTYAIHKWDDKYDVYEVPADGRERKCASGLTLEEATAKAKRGLFDSVNAKDAFSINKLR